ncbi:MAG: hypothetical protein WC663_05520 [Patescibacteria group bacterium]|jgi:hypothetical protein
MDKQTQKEFTNLKKLIKDGFKMQDDGIVEKLDKFKLSIDEKMIN